MIALIFEIVEASRIMKTLEQGKDKIQKICDKLRIETLEPAQQEAAQIIEEANARAEQILAEARGEAEGYLHEARKQIEQERNVFKSSLAQAGKQSLEALRQSIEKDLFNDQLVSTVEKESAKPDFVAKILEAIVAAVERDGVSADFAAILPETVSKEELARSIGAAVMKKLEKHPFTISEFRGGVQLKLVDRKMTVDISDETLKELLAGYVRKDFHTLLFGEWKNG